MSNNAEGVWVILEPEYTEVITAVFPTERDALRFLNGRGYGRVVFLEWGQEVAGVQS